MKWEKSDARKMKCQALWWLRIRQRCAFIATEAGGYNSDVLGVNEKRMYEIEVKTNELDIRNDFKKWKHQQYFNARDGGGDYTSTNRWVPNRFYFCVPNSLVGFTEKMIEEKGYKPYGIISSEEFVVVRRAMDLHKREPQTQVKFILALRMGSELLRFHEAML